MKNLIVLFSYAILFSSSSSTLTGKLQQHLPDIIRFPWTSRIPQFIRDAGHPWLEKNRDYLERLDDPVKALCSLDSSLRPVKDGAEFAYPTDFFHHLEVDSNRVGIDRLGWTNARLRLNEMLACPAALHDVEDFNVEIWADDISNRTEWLPIVGSHIPELFFEVLSSMKNLRKLRWNTFGERIEELQAALTKGNLRLPSVRHLVPAMYTEYLVSMCPEVEVIDAGHSIDTAGYWRWTGTDDARMRLIKATKLAKNLTTFGMQGEWEVEHLEELLAASPNITTLKMLGEISGAHRWYDEWEASSELFKYIEIMSQFPHLAHLHLPYAAHLRLGFSGGAWCGNAYFGRQGRAYGREIARRSAKTTELAAEMVLSKLHNLKTLSIGATCANLTKNKHGQWNSTWPWTGRMTEWTYEVWPEREAFPGEDDLEYE